MEAKRRIIVRDLRNAMGKMRRSLVVAIVKLCWMPKRMKRMPDVTNRPIMRTLDQA